ncbi:MAG: hypothetical protein WC998_05195 [Candidatus Paceibacterota bacterium]
MYQEYQAIHKCRLCGENVLGGITGERTASVCAFEASHGRRYETSFAPRITETHICKDGSMGITDFQGFKKVGD